MNAPATTGVDLLAQAVESLRPMLLSGPTKVRIRALWAAAKNARALATQDQIESTFLQLAVEINLIDARGYWTGSDVRRHGKQDVLHVLRWAAHGRDPFERLRR